MATKIQLRRDTAANWSSANTVLSQGEIGYDLTNDRFKIGDGSTAWNSLGYATEALGHNHDNRYYTEAEVDTLLAGKEDSNANIQSHITDTDNPHSVTKTQVGLGNVENYGIATLAEAEAGTATDKYMTPQRTKEAILELSPPTDLSAVNNHIADSTIHFTQSAISITESQISDFGSYEPAFVKNTAFNKNFGTGSGEVSEGDHTHTFAEITNKPTTLSGYGITDSLYTQSEVDTLLGGKSDTGHTHTESDITDLDKYTQTQVDSLLAGKVGTTSAQALDATDALSITGNVLYLNKANGTSESVDLSLYLDDSNLARIVSGTYVSASQVLRFTRDDNSTFDVDASMFFDDTNLVTSVSGGNAITVSQTTGAVTVNHADTSSLSSTNNSGRTYIQNISLDTYGHITGLTTATETVADTDTITRLRGTTGGTFVSGDITLVPGGATSISQSGNTITITSTDTNTDTNNYLTGISGSGDGTVTFTRQGLSDLTWDASHTHSEYLTSLPTHNHNDLYYTESEVNSLLSGKLGSTATAVNSDKVDGYHIVVGSTGSDTNTLYFITQGV